MEDRSSAHPVAFGPVVVWAAGVYTLLAVANFAVLVAALVAWGTRYEGQEERQWSLIPYIFDRCREHDVTRAVNVMAGVPRHLFVPETQRDNAYRGPALPIGWGRTIPDAALVALMAELAVPVLTHEVELGASEEATAFTVPTVPVPGHKVLEVGTGSGYLAAVLSEMVDHVYTIEPVEALAEQAATTLGDLGYGNVTVRVGDAFKGWPEHAPFDSIVVKEPVERVPQPLIDQLAVGGKLVAPVGPPDGMQELQVLEKRADGSVERTSVLQVHLPPLTGDRR